MPRPRAGERVLGPFPKWGDRAKAIPWTGRSRIIHVHPGRLNDKGSEETPFYFATRAEALEAKQRLEGLTEEATRTVAQTVIIGPPFRDAAELAGARRGSRLPRRR